MIEQEAEIDRLVCSLVWHYVGKNPIHRFLDYNTVEELISEARLCAWIAINNYRNDKNTSLTTYVYTCVNNRLQNICLSEHKNPEISSIDEETYVEPSYSEERDRELVLTMQSILTEKEYEVFHFYFIEDCSIREIQRKTKQKFHEVRTCLHRILESYSALEKTQEKLLTMRRLQKKWIEDSQN